MIAQIAYVSNINCLLSLAATKVTIQWQSFFAVFTCLTSLLYFLVLASLIPSNLFVYTCLL